MKVALNRTQGRAANDGGLFSARTAGLADSPDAQATIKRIGESLCRFSPIDRAEYAVTVAHVALAAKRQPNNAYAKATA